MKISLRLAGCAIAVSLFLAKTAAARPEKPAASGTALNGAALEYSRFLQKESIGLRIRQGLPIDELPDLSPDKAERDAAVGRALLAKLDGVRVSDLSHEEEISLEMLRREARWLADGPSRYWLTFPATPYTLQFLIPQSAFSTHPFRNRGDADHYEKLLSKYALFLESLQGKLREQSRRGIVMPKPEIPLVTSAFEAAGREKGDNLFSIAAERLAALPAAEREAFSARVADRIEKEIRPAVRRLTEYLNGEYAAKAPASVGLAQYPGGPEVYRAMVRRTTTLDVAPEEIHRIGLQAMDQLNARLDAIRVRLRFEGTLADFRKSLKSDPRFYAKTPDEVGERLMSAQNRILKKLPEFFGRTPKAPFGVKRLEPQLEPSMTFGYYQVPTPQDAKGYYKYNGTHLEGRSLIGAGSLISHELMPGHHMQISLQQENAELPQWRRESAISYTAFIEGWGEYSSFLAGEMGMYEDPYDLAGRLLFDAFLTSRLVVDTGMNLLGWPREKAMQFMRDNTIQSETEIATETLRYSCDLPAQALAYKMGMRKFVELREKARSALGPAFDMRRYHDMLLSSGAVPLDLAERKVDWFIAEEKSAAAKR
ncbi:MAG: DUF885 domain-containing protein [Acidobacteria bacterium]|nr:DUF885 domain-containing protein [Acidobacteriota bacterium]MCA1609565.1 DUF885 domain-containing protein [Acidobacteriota bacterium]